MARRIARDRGQRVRAVGHGRRRPRHLVRRRRVFRAERRAVEQELHADDADVVRRGRASRVTVAARRVLAAAGLVTATVGAVVSFATVTLTLVAVV